MGHGHKVACVLCQRSEETNITGALSTKNQVTAHQNCLLFSSGIYCQNSPQFDDLFGFSAEDVMKEVKRGSKLNCSRCKKKGATAGCEVKCCKKSYHYPCAVHEGAETVEDEDRGHYKLYCSKHSQVQRRNHVPNGINGFLAKPPTSKKSSEAGSAKRTEGRVLMESLDNSITMSFCKKHAPSSSKNNNNGDSSAAGPSVYHSDSHSSTSTIRPLSKRRLSFDDQQKKPSKRYARGWKIILSDDSTNSDVSEPEKEMAMFAPLESDLEENANSLPADQFIRKDTASPTGSASGNEQVDESRDGNKDNPLVLSETESESLLLPVEICMGSESQSTTSQSDSQSQPAVLPSVVVVREGPSDEQSHAKVTVKSPDSRSFWKGCNAARCTEAIFTDFINEMTVISRRIQSDQASQEECDVALKVMKASGKLGELVAKQQKELKQKQAELQQAAAALKEVASALRR